MSNVSMLRHRFSNERWGGGGGALNHLPLLFCKSVYIDFKNIVKFQVYLLFLAAGLLGDRTCEKGLVNVYIFQQPIALSKTERFQNNSGR